MSITHTTDHERRLVRSRAVGLVTFDALAAHLDAVERLRTAGYAEMLDATGAATDLNARQVRALVTRMEAMTQAGRVGPTAVVTDHDASFGMARMYEILAEDLELPVGVFRTVEEAERWLTAQWAAMARHARGQ